MPQHPPSRRRPAARLVLGLAAAAVLLVGCGTQRDPTSYTSGVKQNIQTGCEQGFSAKPTQEQAGKQTKICQCLVVKMTAPPNQGGIKFSDFSHAETMIRSNPQKYRIETELPQAVKLLEQCTNQVSPTTTVVGPVAPATSTTVAKPASN